jgi:hypothetical protein
MQAEPLRARGRPKTTTDEERKQKRAAYMRKYCAENADKMNQASVRYHARIRERAALYVKNNSGASIITN